MSKDEKVGTSTAISNYLVTWIKYSIFLFVTARLGAGNLYRLVNWKKSMKQPDDLSKMPYSANNKPMWGGGQAGGNFAAKMAARAAKAALAKKMAAAKEAAKKVASGNLRGAFTAGKSNITESSGKHDLPYSLIGGNVMSDWIGRNIAYSFATQRKLFNKFFEFIGPMVYGDNWKGGKSDLHLYIVNWFNVLFMSWIFFWFLFWGQLAFGNLITIWGASIFGGVLSKSWGPDWTTKAFDFGYGMLENYLFHGLFCIIPWLIFFCLELPIISTIQISLLVLWFWYYSYYDGPGDAARYHWKLLFKYPRILFYVLFIMGIMAAVVELSGDHLENPQAAQGWMYPIVIIKMIIILIIEYQHRGAAKPAA